MFLPTCPHQTFSCLIASQRFFIPSLLILLLLANLVQADRQVPADRTLSGHTAAVMCVEFLPDGQTAVTGSRDRTVKIWDLKAGRAIRTLEAHTGFVFALAASPDGQRVASAGADATVRVWEVKSGKLIALLEGHTGSVIGLKYLPNGQLYSAGRDGLRLWDVDQEKLIWKNGVGVSEFSASADGTRAVVTNYSDGMHEVWDLSKHVSICTLGNVARMRPGLVITPDGTEVFGHDNAQPQVLHHWSVATGDELPFKDPGTTIERLAISPDGSLLLTGSVYGKLDIAMIWDTKSWKLLRYFEGPPEISQTLLSYTFSPDSKTLLATSGVYMLNEEGVHGQRSDQLLIYDLSDLRTPEAQGAKAGKLSWQETPIKIRTLDGKVTDLAAYKPPANDPIPVWNRCALADGFDALHTNKSIFFQRAPDQIEQVLVEPTAVFDPPIWDGSHVWVTSQDGRIFVLDGKGQLVTKIGAEQGIPPSDARLMLYPLADGRVLACGVAGKGGNTDVGTGWCGIIDLHADDKPSAPPHIEVLFKESQLPERWTRGVGNSRSALIPKWISEPPLPKSDDATKKQHRCVWIACDSANVQTMPVLRVDPDAKTVETYNVAEVNEKWEHLNWPKSTNTPYWLSPIELMDDEYDVCRVPIGPTILDLKNKKLVLQSIIWPNDSTYGKPFLPIAGQLYLAGKRWHRIDPQSLEVEDIGPGFRFHGELAGDEVAYFNSGVFGAIAVVKDTGQVFRLSVDPNHPLAIPATLDPVFGKPLPPEGAIEFRYGLTLFYCGDGALTFADGALKPGRSVLYPYRNPRADLDAEMTRVQKIIARLRNYSSEKERLQLTADQWHRFETRADKSVQVDAKQLEELFTAWTRAADDAAKAAAARALLAQTKAIADRDTKLTREVIDEFKAIFTPRQWKLLNYEIPDK